MIHHFAGLLIASNLLALPADGPAQLRSIDPDEQTGTSRAVVVDPTSLLHTTQLLPVDERGKVMGHVAPAEQVDILMKRLQSVLSDSGSGSDRTVKLNVYVGRDDVIPFARAAFSRTFRGRVKPAVSYVVTALPHPDASIAVDAVAAVADGAAENGTVRRRRVAGSRGHPRMADVSVLPRGRTVYVSGQAERGTLPVATRETLQSLERTLKFLGLNRAHVVQIKAFLKPMAEVSVVEETIAQFFDGELAPPVSYVEWTNNSPIEIELIAAAPGAASAQNERERIRFLTPPGMKASPVFSRVTLIEPGRSVYVSGLYGRPQTGGEQQIRDIFAELDRLLNRANSDLRHLAKATYYVSSSESSSKLGPVRLEVYDPLRPPAASKASVRRVGFPGRSITIDMIAATRE